MFMLSSVESWERGIAENSGQHSYCTNFAPDNACAKFRTAIKEMKYPEATLRSGKGKKMERSSK